MSFGFLLTYILGSGIDVCGFVIQVNSLSDKFFFSCWFQDFLLVFGFQHFTMIHLFVDLLCVSHLEFTELPGRADSCSSVNLGTFQPLFPQIFFLLFLSLLLQYPVTPMVACPLFFWGSVHFSSFFFLFFGLNNLYLQIANSSASSNLLLSPSNEFFILVILLNSRISTF